MQKSQSVRWDIANAIGLTLGNACNACYISLNGFFTWVTHVLCHPCITPNKNIKTNFSSCIHHCICSVSSTIVRSRVLCLTKELLSIACLDKPQRLQTAAWIAGFTSDTSALLLHLYKYSEKLNYRSLCLSIMSPSWTNSWRPPRARGKSTVFSVGFKHPQFIMHTCFTCFIEKTTH